MFDVWCSRLKKKTHSLFPGQALCLLFNNSIEPPALLIHWNRMWLDGSLLLFQSICDLRLDWLVAWEFFGLRFLISKALLSDWTWRMLVSFAKKGGTLWTMWHLPLITVLLLLHHSLWIYLSVALGLLAEFCPSPPCSACCLQSFESFFFFSIWIVLIMMVFNLNYRRLGV